MIQAYVRATAPRGRETEQVGPFLATYSPGTPHPMLNYAIPDDGAQPTAAEIDALTAAYRRRDLLPRLEYFTDVAPDLEKLLVEAGYELERRVPLMTCAPAERVDRPAPAGIRLRVPESDEDLRRMRAAQNTAFGEPAEIGDEEVEQLKTGLEAGVRHLLAEDDGVVVGGGLALEIVDGTTEIAGIAVLEPYRGRGIAAALTGHLTREVHEAGAHTAFLTPGDLGIGVVYARVGYRPAGECVHLSLT
ncbi:MULTISPECIES: GNAT family N-acetyltransferase [unclassified Amycolatopsis]|uniref:GNAT family N-acetyltransferase n=1 Tax=unclassified Amycolatopsis TaxID=2618356 RepID=UPI002875DFFA|nr:MULTISPECIES: GNAT family N-acetyltransferase [unclassified Amycolatopsis]MDS0133944.1 GNAT family N-acetyltransferase [Amycolatopsis sp. 505]MDS0144820.1 GNAT family N-acetyltransferase [Amycolatopsis sp. CM201R]